jgi:YD repeat-containing protein
LSCHNLLSGKTRTWTYTWDAHNRLVQVRTPDDTRWRYTYDPLGRRVSKQRLTDQPTDTDVVTADTPVTEQTRFTWDSPTLAETHHTPNGQVTTFDYQPGTSSPSDGTPTAHSGSPASTMTRRPQPVASTRTYRLRATKTSGQLLPYTVDYGLDLGDRDVDGGCAGEFG